MTSPNPLTDRREWNAESYHRVSNAHVDWGQEVIARLPLAGDETVIDAGCGTGRLTALLLERLPQGQVIAIDQSSNMLEQARVHLDARFPGRVTYLNADVLDLDLATIADVVFSTATFHWVKDHDALFRTIHRALKPGGLLLAQCGGGPNIQPTAEHALSVLRSDRFAAWTGNWEGPWNFAWPDETMGRLRQAGFVNAEADLVHAPVTLPNAREYREFLATVVLGTHLQRLPNDALRSAFLDEMVEHGEGGTPPWQLDYWRLNLTGARSTDR